MLTLYFVLQEYRRFTGSEPAVARCNTRDELTLYFVLQEYRRFTGAEPAVARCIREISANPIFCLTGV